MSVYLKKDSPFCPYDIPNMISNSTEWIAKNFILFDKHVNFLGSRDPCNPAFFILEQKNIYQSGTREFITHRLTEEQVNELFYRLENLDQSNSLNKILYVCN